MHDERFDRFIEQTLDIEQARSNDPNDPGGLTVWGVSSRWHPKLFEDGEPTLEEVRAFYYAEFWKALRLDEIESDDIAAKMLDTAINLSQRRASLWAQKAHNMLAREGYEYLVEDGIIGDKTIRYVNAFARLSPECEVAFLNGFTYFQANHYANEGDRHHGRGWFAKRVGWRFAR